MAALHVYCRTIYHPRGRVLGGSSSINAMIFARGHAFDYDRWDREGATGWSYADCLPYFKRLERYEHGMSVFTTQGLDHLYALPNKFFAFSRHFHVKRCLSSQTHSLTQDERKKLIYLDFVGLKQIKLS